MSKLIAFTGAMGSGKTTAIEHLETITGFKQLSPVKFAGPLYDMQEFIYRRIRSVYKKPPGFIKDRKLLQWLGTEWGRDTISKTLWVDIWKAEVNYILENYTNRVVVCDDLRFDNEAEAVKDIGGKIIKLTSNKNLDRITTANGISGHQSESGINDKYVDFVIDNNDTIDEFKKKLDNVFNKIKGEL